MDDPDPAETPQGRRRWWWVGGLIVVVLAAIAGGFYLWATNTPELEPAARAALESDDRVVVTENGGYTFTPADDPNVGFILYPGGRVDPASYAVPARQIAEAGYLVAIPEVTLNLAVLDAEAADEIITAHPEIDVWVVGGHSLGGTMAARYAAASHQVCGLVMWAAYPEASTDLSSIDIDVASVFGTEDGLTSVTDIEDSRGRLPAATNFAPIVGGNHAQFGDYGAQAGDNPATISKAQQQAEAVQATVQTLVDAQNSACAG